MWMFKIRNWYVVPKLLEVAKQTRIRIIAKETEKKSDAPAAALTLVLALA